MTESVAFDFAEATRLYADIARKSSELITQALQKPPSAANALDDELGIARAFFDAWAKLAADPAALAQQQLKVWQIGRAHV